MAFKFCPTIAADARPGQKSYMQHVEIPEKGRIISGAGFTVFRFLLWVYAPDNDVPSRLS